MKMKINIFITSKYFHMSITDRRMHGRTDGQTDRLPERVNWLGDNHEMWSPGNREKTHIY